eukprot:3414526-Pleurochrysis_carterae.AAC.1
MSGSEASYGNRASYVSKSGWLVKQGADGWTVGCRLALCHVTTPMYLRTFLVLKCRPHLSNLEEALVRLGRPVAEVL